MVSVGKVEAMNLYLTHLRERKCEYCCFVLARCAEGAVRGAWCVVRWPGSARCPLCPLCPHFNRVYDPKGQLLLDGTMGRIGRMGRMIMGQGGNGTVLWGTMGLWDSTTHYTSTTQAVQKYYTSSTQAPCTFLLPPVTCPLHPFCSI